MPGLQPWYKLKVSMTALSNFPIFTPVSLSHKDAIRELARRFPPYSDFNFTSLFSWDIEGVSAVALLHGNLVLRLSDYVSGSPVLSFLGIHMLPETLDTLFDYCRSAPIEPRLQLIGQTVVDSLPPSAADKLTIVEDRDSYDYILSIQELCDFKTSQYGTKKRMYNRLVREHQGRIVCRPLNLSSDTLVRELHDVFEAWQKSQNKTAEDVRSELGAFERCLDHVEDLGVQAYGTYLDGRIIAFTLYEILPGNMAMGHFLKADANIDGVFMHLLHNFAKYLATKGVTLINIEQDLGIEGLRRSKESYHPVKFLKKYTISQKM